ncbi:hypothetical protein RJ640_000334, partial [Escallonia rubra]
MFLRTLPSSKPPIHCKTISTSLHLFFTHPIASHSEQPHTNDVPEESISVASRSYWTKKIHKLCTVDRNVDQALRLLDRLRLHGYRPESLNVSSVIHALCHSKRFPEAHHRFLLYLASNCIPDERTCNVVIARLLHSKTPILTLQVFHRLNAVKPEFVPSLVNYNRLIDQLCLLSHTYEAHKLFIDMKSRGHQPNTVSYTTLINGYVRIGEVGYAHKVLDEMLQYGVRPNSFTYSVLIRGVLRSKDFKRGRELMGDFWETMEGEEDPTANNAAFANLIDCLCQEGLFCEVFEIAEYMPQSKTVCDEFAYGEMVDTLCRYARYNGAARIVYMMRKRGFRPSLVSYNSIIHGLSKDRVCMRAYQLLEEGIKFGYLPSEFTYKVLIERLCQECDIGKANKLLQFMLKKGGVDSTRIYNIYLRALCLLKNPTELLNVLVFMLQTRCQPDVITLNTVIHGFCQVGRIGEPLKILHDMRTGKFCAPDCVTFTTLIRGLLNVGRTEEALDMLHN